ncbi:hypothetical protein Tco_1521837 [Tanacetum coccineum]
MLKSEFEKVKQEKDSIDFKIKKFDKASKDLDQLLGSQITDKSKKGLGYSAVPPPHPLIYNRPNKLDLSYSGLDEFKEPEFKEEQVSQDKSSFETSPNVDKETVFPVNKKVEFTKPKNHEKPVKKSVRYAEMYRSQSLRGNQRNWNGQKSSQLGKDFYVQKNQTRLGISKEVGTPRYLSVVVPLTKVGDEAIHKKLGDGMERAATTASS